MADTPVEVDVNTDNLDEFTALFNGKATAKAPEPTPDEIEDVDPVDDTDETEEQIETDPEDAPDGDEEAEVEDADAEDEDANILKPKPKKNTAKDRIDELTAEKYAERRRADALETRLADLERRLREPEPKPAPQEQVETGRINPDAVDKDGQLLYPLGEFDPQYVADLTQHIIKRDLAAARETMRQEAEQTKQQEADRQIAAQWENKLNESAKEIPDLRESIKSLDTHFANIEPKYGVYLAQTIMGLDSGPEVLYYLANNPDEADTIVAAGPTGATLALGRLEARIQAALSRKATPPPRQTTAPKPAAQTRGSGARHSARADTDNLDDFEKLFFKK